MRRRLAYFMTVVMTFGMLMGVPAKGSVVEAATAGSYTTEGGLTITGGTYDDDYSYSDGKLSIKSSTPMTITTAGEEISDSIYIGSSSGHDVNLTLESLVIVTDGTPGIEIEDNYKGNVNLTLVGTTTRGTNYNVDAATNFIQGNDAPAIQKNGTSGGTLTIKGTGDLWVESLGDGVAAIGGSKGNSSGNIQISNGIVSAVAYSTGAAIGGGAGGDGTNIKISGGDVYTNILIPTTENYPDTKSYGASIGGGGSGGDGINITISGGKVDANATASGNHTGAGIGGGHLGVANGIVISGGTVVAKGGYNSAGIGAGSEDYYLGDSYIEKKNTDVSVSGGKITATGGGMLGAGIGSGSKWPTTDRTVTTVTITGGTVVANGGQDAPGVGAGQMASAVTYISGGSVLAKGGSTAISTNKYTGQDVGFGEHQMDKTDTYSRVLQRTSSDDTQVSLYTHPLSNTANFNSGKIALEITYNGSVYNYGMNDVTPTDGKVYLYLPANATVAEKATNEYSVTTEATSGGKVTAETSAYGGSNYTFDVSANDGYVISSVKYKVGSGSYATLTKISGSDTIASYTIPGSVITGNISIQATFVSNKVTVAKESVTNGTIEAATTAEKGKSFTFTVTPNTGYDISSVSYKIGNGSYQTIYGSNGSYTIEGSSITDNITLKAEFIKQVVVIPEYSVTTESAANGSITVASTVKSGEALAFTVNANTYYTISSVAYKVGNGSYITMHRVSGSDTSANYTISGSVVTDNISIKATFERETVNVTKEAVTNGTITADTTAEKGNSFTFTVTPSTGYDISKVYYKVGNGDYQEISGSNGSYTIEGSRVTDNITLKAEFTQQVVVIPEYSVTTESTTNGSITAASTVKSGEALTFTVEAAPYYTISSVAYKVGNGSYTNFTTSGTDTSASYTIPGSAVTGNISIKATFTRATVTVTKEFVTNGTITAATTAEKGNSLTFTVEAAPYYTISSVAYKVGNGSYTNFTTSGTDTSASYTISGSAVTDDISIKATFTRATVTVTKESAANGTIAAATTAEKGNSFNFTVTPSTGYDISKVYYKVGNGDYQELTGSNGSYTITGSNVTDNISIKAEFVLKTLSVTKASVSNATVSGASTIGWGTDYTFDVSANTGYMISNVSYQVNGGTKKNMTKVSGDIYSARYTIPGSAVTGAISINVETKKVLDLSSLEWNYSGGYYYKNADYTVELTIPSDIQAGIQSLEYRDNRKSDIGSYTATATITCKDGYYIVGSVQPCSWKILEYTPQNLSIKYNYSTTKKEWYNTAVTVSADNYLIAEGSVDGYFGSNVTYTATATKTLYFKHATTGYITSGRVVGVQIDTVKPTGSIRIDNASFDQDKWDGSTNASRYHLSSTAVSIHADDYVNGYQIAYHVTDQTYYKSDLENANLNWVNGTSCSIQDNTKQRVYARIIDQAGNITYLSTPLIYNDTVVPTIGVQQTSVTSSGARYEMTFKDDAGSVKYAYVLLKDTEEAPSDYNAILAKINEGAIGGTGTGVDATASFSSLSPNTKYALYIAASDGLSTLNGLSNANVSAVGKYSFTTSRATAVLHDCTEPIKPVTSATNETFDLKAKLFDEAKIDISTFRNIKYSISVGSGNVLSKTPSEPDGNTLTLPVRANPSGEQEVYITVKSDNYEDIKVTLTLVVTSKVQLELSGVSCPTYTYNDIPQNYPGYTGNIVWKNGDAIVSGVNTTVTFQGGDNYNSTNPPTEAGRYTITFTISNNADYIGSKTMTYVIEKATIDMSSVAWYLDDETVPSVDGREVVNDGEQHQMTFGGYPENLIRVSYKQDERYVTSGSETGQYATRVDYEVIDSKNYNTPNPAYNTISWEIVNPEIQKENPDMSKVKWVYQQGETEQEYKQGETKLVANGNEYTVMLTGLPDYVTPEYSGVTSATDAGEYKVSVSFQVSDDSRYIVPDDMTLTWSVSEKEIEKETEKLTPDMSKVKWIYTYNGVTSDYITGTTKLIEDGSEYNLSLAGVPEGVTVDYSGTVTSSKAGNYTVKATFTNADATKYTDPSPTSMELNWSIDAATQEDNDSSNETPVVGAEEVVGTNKYKVVSSSTTGGTVEYTGPMDKTVAAVTVPATVEVNGQSYQVTTIGTGAFSGCKQLSSITIQSGITTIGKNAFKGCTKLKTVNVPGSVTSIGSNAFNGCTALTKVTIGKKVTTIGAGAFSGCKKLKTVTISNSAALKTVGDKAFYKCVALTKIVLPKNVTTIGKSAFEGCKKLKTITIKSKKLKKVGSKAIKGIYNKATIKCPGKTYVKKYKKLFKSKTGYKKTMKIK